MDGRPTELTNKSLYKRTSQWLLGCYSKVMPVRVELRPNHKKVHILSYLWT